MAVMAVMAVMETEALAALVLRTNLLCYMVGLEGLVALAMTALR